MQNHSGVDNAGKLAVASLVRRVASISIAHEARGFPNPCRAELVRATMRGIKRQLGTTQREAKPLLKEDLFRVLDAMGDEVKDARDRALLLLGFAGGFRRSELVGLDHSDIEHVRQGVIIHLRRSKTDQEGAGRKIGIPYGRTRYCPVLALESWIEVSGTGTGAIFRPVDRHGRIASARLSGRRRLRHRARAGRGCGSRPHSVFGPQSEGGVRDQRGPGWRLVPKDQGANRPCVGRHARPVCSRW